MVFFCCFFLEWVCKESMYLAYTCIAVLFSWIAPHLNLIRFLGHTETWQGDETLEVTLKLDFYRQLGWTLDRDWSWHSSLFINLIEKFIFRLSHAETNAQVAYKAMCSHSNYTVFIVIVLWADHRTLLFQMQSLTVWSHIWHLGMTPQFPAGAVSGRPS